MIALLILFYSAAYALPPIPSCAAQLVAPQALAAYADVRRAHPEFYRAHVGFLLEAWHNDEGDCAEWGIYDTHGGQKVYRLKYEYYRWLNDGDLIYVYDRGWHLLGHGEFAREPVPFLYRNFLGMTARSTTPQIRRWRGELAEPPPVLQLWMEGQYAIVLSQTDAADRARWLRESAPDYARYQENLKNPREVLGQDFAYRLAHYETALEGRPVVRRQGDEILLGVQTEGATRPVTRGDYIFLFDADDRLLEAHKKHEATGFATFGGAITPDEIFARLTCARRVVVIKHHKFILEIQ